MNLAREKRKRYLRSMRPQLERKFKEQEGKCFYCECSTWIGFAYGRMDEQVTILNRQANKTMTFPYINAIRATREHLLRVVDGGSDCDDNIVMACAYCNHARGDRTIEEWKAVRGFSGIMSLTQQAK